MPRRKKVDLEKETKNLTTKRRKTSKSKSKAQKPRETPLMRQYNQIKNKYPDAILLFRVGDFYETFGPDAVTAARVLGITLTKRHNGAASEIELAGFPYHALDMYLPKLVRAGYRTAICDQLEDPKKTKKLVKRGVTELITPGVALSEKILDHTKNNYLASVFFDRKDNLGIAFTDISTGEFLLAEGEQEHIDKLLQSFAPSEIILPKNKQKQFIELFGNKLYTYPLEDWIFAPDYTNEILLRHFNTTSLKGFGVADQKAGIIAAGSIIHYLGETQHPHLQHISNISRIKQDRYVWLDKFTIRNLELLQSTHPSGTPLLKILDHSISPMGSRLLKKWIALPLKDRQHIEARHSMVRFFLEQEECMETIQSNIKQMGDMERLIARVAVGKVNPRQVLQIKRALQAIVPVKQACAAAENPHFNEIAEQLNPCKLISDKIERTLTENPPVQVGKGDIIASGISTELDELRHLTHSSKEALLQIQQRESERTGITSLKIGFNNVFGYYLEVRNRFKNHVPEEWIRRQTLASAERYITQELKEYEDKILGAEEKILKLETELFAELVKSLGEYIRPVQLNATLIARLDCLLSFAKVASRNNYYQPELNDSLIIDIKEGRHPVIEQQMPLGEEYVPNDIYLDSDKQQLFIITGPNMSGKSALLRQTALIVLMAQMGSFVPAESAKIGWVDKVFTRVGASDNISSGESTFMVEMNETASIMNNISQRSLILLDEIGRGTSTYDGISIAWALAEYLHDLSGVQPKTLFATHYHELTELANKFDRIHNFSVATKEVGNKVIFLRKLVTGSAERSFGIHVAAMAGMPKPILQRAKQILFELEQKSIAESIDTRAKSKLAKIPKKQAGEAVQLNIFEVGSPELQRVKDFFAKTDINTLTPIEALIRLNELKGVFE